MEYVISVLLSGISVGGQYALIAIGYTLVYGILRLINFAHGDVFMVAGLMGIYLTATLPIPAALVLVVILTVVLGFTIERVAYKPLREAPRMSVMISAIGVSYLLQSLAQIIFGSGETHAQLPTMGTLTIGAISIKHATLLTLACSLVVMVALFLFVKFSKTGRAMVAVSEDKGAAQLMGININFIITITFAIGSALAAFAGLFKLMNSEPVTPVFGSLPGIIAFTAAVVGGIGSIPGAMVGGLLLGVIECFCLSVPALATYTNAIQFAILIVILLVKPTGLLGKKRREKV